MKTRLRRLPLVRSRSNVELGIYSAVVGVLVLATGFAIAFDSNVVDPPRDLPVTIAGVGSAIVIAYSVGISGIVRRTRRGSDREIWLGFVTGLGICGVLGVTFAVALIDASHPFGWLGKLALCWAGCSIALLAGQVAALPLFAYEGARSEHLNQDE